MNISPIQLRQLLFRRVRVDMDDAHQPPAAEAPGDHIVLFEGVNIGTGFGIQPLNVPDAPGQHYGLSLQVTIDNQASPDAPEQMFSPYLVDIEAVGVVTVLPGAEQLASPEDLAAVNGAALLWSAIREQVLTLTSRMPAGQAMLPTVNFQDLKRAPDAGTAPPAAAAPAAHKRVARRPNR